MTMWAIHWAVINSTASLIVALMIGYDLRRNFTYYILVQRIGLAFTAAAFILTIAPILANRGAPYVSSAGTPFNMWPSFMLRVAIGLMIGGNIWRHWRHDRANRQQVAFAEARLGRRT